MSEIERRIKEKIEKAGAPLKDWDIQINYGIKTGFNEAFIISGEKRKQILDNCGTDEERIKTDELIRPILRGRDIKRYSYNFADLYLITTFPSLKIDIEQYPAVKQHLLSFGYDRLKQTGDKGARKKTNNKWFETQDSISYWEDFSKQKIAWNRIASEKLFSLIREGMIIQDSMHFFTGNHLEYLCGILNSKLFQWYLYLLIGDAAGGNAGNSDNIKKLCVPFPTIEIENTIKKLIAKGDFKTINQIVYKLYKLEESEIKFIESQ